VQGPAAPDESGLAWRSRLASLLPYTRVISLLRSDDQLSPTPPRERERDALALFWRSAATRSAFFFVAVSKLESSVMRARIAWIALARLFPFLLLPRGGLRKLFPCCGAPGMRDERLLRPRSPPLPRPLLRVRRDAANGSVLLLLVTLAPTPGHGAWPPLVLGGVSTCG
jgi:hypothetical protein